MTTINISAKERELISEINQDESLLESALKHVRKLKKSKTQAPCQYSTKELKARLQRGRQALKDGDYKSQAEMRSKYTL